MRRLSFIPDQPNLANMHKYGLNFIIPIYISMLIDGKIRVNPFTGSALYTERITHKTWARRRSGEMVNIKSLVLIIHKCNTYWYMQYDQNITLHIAWNNNYKSKSLYM